LKHKTFFSADNIEKSESSPENDMHKRTGKALGIIFLQLNRFKPLTVGRFEHASWFCGDGGAGCLSKNPPYPASSPFLLLGLQISVHSAKTGSRHGPILYG